MVFAMNEMQRLRVHRDMRDVMPDLRPEEREHERSDGEADRFRSREECTTADEGGKKNRVDWRRHPRIANLPRALPRWFVQLVDRLDRVRAHVPIAAEDERIV